MRSKLYAALAAIVMVLSMMSFAPPASAEVFCSDARTSVVRAEAFSKVNVRTAMRFRECANKRNRWVEPISIIGSWRSTLKNPRSCGWGDPFQYVSYRVYMNDSDGRNYAAKYFEVHCTRSYYNHLVVNIKDAPNMYIVDGVWPKWKSVMHQHLNFGVPDFEIQISKPFGKDISS